MARLAYTANDNEMRVNRMPSFTNGAIVSANRFNRTAAHASSFLRRYCTRKGAKWQQYSPAKIGTNQMALGCTLKSKNGHMSRQLASKASGTIQTILHLWSYNGGNIEVV